MTCSYDSVAVGITGYSRKTGIEWHLRLSDMLNFHLKNLLLLNTNSYKDSTQKMIFFIFSSLFLSQKRAWGNMSMGTFGQLWCEAWMGITG